MAMADMAVAAAPSQQLLAKPKVKEKKGPHLPPAAAKPKTGIEIRVPDKMEVDMARQDLFRVCNPDFRRPFSSIEDACERLLPYHVVAEYDPDEMEVSTYEFQTGATTLLVSRSQSWNEILKAKTAEYMGVLEKHINTYNMILRRRAEGEMRGEERLLAEKCLLVDERQKLADARAQIEAKERAEREAQDARVKEALEQAEKARAEVQARAEAQAQAEAALAEAIAQAAQQAQQAEFDHQLNQAFPPELGIENDALQPPMSEEGLENLVGWGTSEVEDEYDEVQPPGKEEYEDEEDEDLPEGVFVEDDPAGSLLEDWADADIVTSMQNDYGDAGELHFNPRESMSKTLKPVSLPVLNTEPAALIALGDCKYVNKVSPE